MSFRITLCVLLSSAAVIALGTLSAVAAPGNEPGEVSGDWIEEVLVTARRREESLQDVPISVSAFSAADLKAKSLNSLKDLAQFTPNFSFSNNSEGGRGRSVVFIRGVGQFESSVFMDPGVGIYLDGVYMGRMLGIDTDLIGLERVEVLRGPQGTLFGKNAIGGAVNMVTTKPNDKFSGVVETTIGRYNRVDGKASINVPLVPGILAARFAVSTRNRDGYGKRIDYFTGEEKEEMGDVSRLASWASFYWTPTDNVNVLLSIDGSRSRENGAVHKLVAAEQPGLIRLLNNFVDPDFGEIFLTDSDFTTFASGPNENRVDTGGVALTVSWDFDGRAVKSISAYRDLEVFNGIDIDGSPYQILEQNLSFDQTQFSQEFQLSGLSLDDRLNWIFGLYYFEEDASEIKPTFIAGELYDAIGLDISASPNSWNDVKSYAAFGQGTYAISDRFNLTAGLRYSRDDKAVTRERIAQNTGDVIVPLDSRKADWDAVTGRVGFEYNWNDDIMGYISVAHGFKSGGINGSSRSSADFLPFNPEYIWTYETGFKSEILDHRLRFNASFFYSDYTDMQFIVSHIDPETGRSLGYIDNAAKSRIKGFEMDFVAAPAQYLTLTAGIGFMDAEYTEVGDGLENVISVDTEFVQTPKWTYTFSGRYLVPLESRGNLIAQLDYAYKSDIQYDLTNAPIAHQDGYGIVNARLTLESADDHWAISLFGTNLMDTRYILGGRDLTDALGWADVQYARPREWGASLEYRF